MIDEFSYELGKRAASGGGGEAVLIDKTISANGTYNASSDNADGFKKAVVSVPNSYAAGDEGKVVSNGALVAQGSDTVTQNGTVDTTLINSLVVNVQGGGGGSSWTKLAEEDYIVDTASSDPTTVGSFVVDASKIDQSKLLLVLIKDILGPRNGYFLGGIAISWLASLSNIANLYYKIGSNGALSGGRGANWGVYLSGAYKSAGGDMTVTIGARYGSSAGTIDGTYRVAVYQLDWPDGISPFTT